jgi:hypothetical protein
MISLMVIVTCWRSGKIPHRPHFSPVDPGTTSGMEIDQRQKNVCPPGEAGQSGQDEHILVGHGISERSFDYPPTNERRGAFQSRIKYTSKGEHFYASRASSRTPPSFLRATSALALFDKTFAGCIGVRPSGAAR